MSLRRVKWAEKERIELTDLQAMSDQTQVMLAEILKYGFAPNGVLRGGEVTADGTFILSLSPLLAIDPTAPLGIILVTVPTAIGPIAANDDDGANPGHADRIDLLSIQYAETDVHGNRTFIASDASTSDADTVIADTSSFTTQIDSAYGATPATPAGFVPLATITVPWGASGITQDDVSLVSSSRGGADPAVFYPRFYYPAVDINTGDEFVLQPNAFPYTHTLFAGSLPALPGTVVGQFACSFSIEAGLVTTGYEWFIQCTHPSGLNVARAWQTVPYGDLGSRMQHFNLHGILWPGLAAGPISLVVGLQHPDGTDHPGISGGGVKIKALRATVVYFSTIYPWPGAIWIPMI